MGAWGVLPFDNDTATDWASRLFCVDDLSLIESAIADAEWFGDDIDDATANIAIAACEVLARLRGRYGYHNGYTRDADAWTVAHRHIVPPPALLKRAATVLDGLMGAGSKLSAAWKTDDLRRKWRASMAELRRRVLN